MLVEWIRLAVVHLICYSGIRLLTLIVMLCLLEWKYGLELCCLTFTCIRFACRSKLERGCGLQMILDRFLVFTEFWGTLRSYHLVYFLSEVIINFDIKWKCCHGYVVGLEMLMTSMLRFVVWCKFCHEFSVFLSWFQMPY